MVIPLKLDSDATIAQLRRLAQEGGNAGKAIDQGLDGAKQQAKGLGDQISSLVTHQGYQMLRDAATSLAQGYQATADHVRAIASEFTKLQDTLRIVATFRGERATGEFTVEQARMGASAGLTPDQWVNFQKQFSGFAGQFIGDGAKFSKEQGDDLAKRAAAFMNARGIEASQGGAVFGEILQQAKGGETNDELMERFGQAYTIVEKAKGDPGPLLGQMGQVTAGGVSTTDAAKLLRTMAQRDPGEAGTYSRALLRGLREIRTKGQAGELGITPDMDVFGQVEQIGRAAEASGMKQEDFLSKYFKDEREMGGISAAINFGVKGGLFKMADQEAAGVTGRTDVEAVEQFRNNEGRRTFTEAGLAASRVERGEIYDPVMQLRLEAEKALSQEGRFERYEFSDLFRSASSWFAGPVKEQLISQRALNMAQEQAGVPVGGGSGEPTLLVNQRITELLEKIEAKTPDQATRPLAAPPPNPPTRQ